VLLGLNKLLSCKLSRKELLEIAEQLGADVSFFLFSASRAIGRGKGEILTSLRWRRKNWYILVVPKAIAISTQKMYQQIRRNTLTKAPFGVKIVLRALEKGDLTALDKTSFNSFEPILVKRYNEIQRIRKALKSLGAGATLISGSGPCVFGIVQTRKEAMDISKKLRAKEKTWQVIVAKTFSNSKKED
jgi:4-diphosphocytidyl-2-C-methyl-D-erythritol kinase